MRRAALLGN